MAMLDWKDTTSEGDATVSMSAFLMPEDGKVSVERLKQECQDMDLDFATWRIQLLEGHALVTFEERPNPYEEYEELPAAYGMPFWQKALALMTAFTLLAAGVQLGKSANWVALFTLVLPLLHWYYVITKAALALTLFRNK